MTADDDSQQAAADYLLGQESGYAQHTIHTSRAPLLGS